jgi:hypothetical protein
LALTFTLTLTSQLPAGRSKLAIGTRLLAVGSGLGFAPLPPMLAWSTGGNAGSAGGP